MHATKDSGNLENLYELNNAQLSVSFASTRIPHACILGVRCIFMKIFRNK